MTVKRSGRTGKFKKSSKKEFVVQANSLHGHYGYTDFIYKGSQIRGNIRCEIHGLFPCSPANHLAGHGCPDCARKKNGKHRRHSAVEFDKLAKTKHHNKYEYTGDFVNTRSPVTVVCSKHGSWRPVASAHLRGQECLRCSHEFRRRSQSQTFLITANALFGEGHYRYHLVEYVDSHTPVNIVCQKHGTWATTPAHFLKGYGCQQCKKGRSAIRKDRSVSNRVKKWVSHLITDDHLNLL